MSHYQKMKALRTGFSSDFRTAIYADSISHYSSISGIPPLMLTNSKGLPLRDWSITGNTAGVGDYDAETGKYKIPFVCKGDNLFNADQEVINGSISDDNYFYYSATSSCVHIAVQPNTKYYITTDTTIPIFRIGESTAIPSFTDKFITTYRLTNASRFEITTNSNTHYLTFQGSTSLLDVWRNELNVSHYKPISTNIYLDSPLMTDDTLHSNGVITRSDGTTEQTDVPKLPTIRGNCSIDAATTVKPKNMTIKYKSGGR